MKKKWLVVVLLCAVLGGVFSVMSLQSYARIQRGGIEEASFCSINDYINCDLVEASSYSELFGIPVAGFGLFFYLLVVLFTVYAFLSDRNGKATVTFGWWMSLAGVAFSLYMAYIAAFVIKTLCITCVGMYLANIIMAVAFYAAIGVKFRAVFSFSKDYIVSVFSKNNRLDFQPKVMPLLIVSLVVMISGGFLISNASWAKNKVSDAKLKEMMEIHYRQSLAEVSVDETKNPMWGNPKAKVTIVEFSDFQCPFCKLAAFNVRPYLNEFKDKIKLFYVNYPLDNSCNPNVQSSMHPMACMAARAAICSNQQGKFWEYHEDLFRNQHRLSPELVVKLARAHRLDADKLKECMDSPETAAILKNDVESGAHVFMKGVPSIFINGRPLKFWRSPQFLRMVVKKELEYADKPGGVPPLPPLPAPPVRSDSEVQPGEDQPAAPVKAPVPAPAVK